MDGSRYGCLVECTLLKLMFLLIEEKRRIFVEFSVSVFLILIIFFPFIYGLGSVDKKKEKENVNFGEIFRLFFTLYVLI